MNRKNITTFYHTLTFLLLTLLLWSCNPGTSTSNAARGELGDDLALSIQFIPASEPSQAQTVPAQRSTTANDFMAIFSGVREAGHFIVSPSSPSASYYVFAAEVAGQIDTAEAIKNLILDEADTRVLARDKETTGAIELPAGIGFVTVSIVVTSEPITVDTDVNVVESVTFKLTILFSDNIPPDLPTSLELSYYGKELIPSTGDGSFVPETTQYTATHIDYGSGDNYDTYLYSVSPSSGTTLALEFDDVNETTRIFTATITDRVDISRTIDYTVTITLIPRPSTQDLADLVTATNFTANGNSETPVFTEEDPTPNLKTFTAPYTAEFFDGEIILGLPTSDLTELATILAKLTNVSPILEVDSPVPGVVRFRSSSMDVSGTIIITLLEGTTFYPDLPDTITQRQVVYTLNIDLSQAPPSALTSLELFYNSKKILEVTDVFSGDTTHTAAHKDYGEQVYTLAGTVILPGTASAFTTATASDGLTRTVTITVSDDDPTDNIDHNTTTHTVNITLVPRITLDQMHAIVTGATVTIGSADPETPTFVVRSDDGRFRFYTTLADYSRTSFIGDSTFALTLNDPDNRVTSDPSTGMVSLTSDGSATNGMLDISIVEKADDSYMVPSMFLRNNYYSITINLTKAPGPPSIDVSALTVTLADSEPLTTYDDSSRTFSVTDLFNKDPGDPTSIVLAISQGYEFEMSSDYTIDTSNPLEATATFADPAGSDAVDVATLATFNVIETGVPATTYTYTVSGDFLRPPADITAANFTFGVPNQSLRILPPNQNGNTYTISLTGAVNLPNNGPNTTLTFIPPGGFEILAGTDSSYDVPDPDGQARATSDTFAFSVVPSGRTTPVLTYNATIFFLETP